MLLNVRNVDVWVYNCNSFLSLVFISEWSENYNNSIVDKKELQSEINTYIENYDKRSAKRIEAEKEMVDKEDEDGWKTVTKKFVFVIASEIIIS